MDYGFVCFKETTKQEDVPLLTRKDGFDCYLLIVDNTCHLWVFLFAGKKSPITIVTKLLRTHGANSELKWVRTGQGGELAGSATFRSYILEVVSFSN